MELKENTTIVVLGASGDLAKKKTVRGSLPSFPPPVAFQSFR
jgi:glucose-6-phosphate 1-dehydrogenase